MSYCIKEGTDTVEALDNILKAFNLLSEANHLCKFHSKREACEQLDPLFDGYFNAKEKAYEKIKELSICLVKK